MSRSRRKDVERETAQQMEEALAARDRVEGVAEQADQRVGFLKGLRVRWNRVHERNQLAHLFEKDWRATN